VKSPLLSVVIPVTRMDGKLQNLKQTLNAAAKLDIEVILVHDFEEQFTSIQLFELSAEILGLNYVLTEGVYGNPGGARNAGLILASGEWVAFWDSDDLPFVEEFFTMIKKASSSGARVAIGGIETCFFGSEDNKRYFPAFITDSNDSVFQLAQMPAFTRMAFRNVDLSTAKFPALSMGEDLVFLARSKFLEKDIYVHSKSVYLYILNFPGQLTSNSSKLKQISDVWKYLYEEFKETAGTMNVFISFQLVRSLLLNLKLNHTLSLYMFRWILLCLIKNPYMTFVIIVRILKNHDFLERKEQN
jgi:glycosyltransferase involved in cell wall biosynthesis